jgi:hypothetical protein
MLAEIFSVINVTAEVGASRPISGNPTNQELRQQGLVPVQNGTAPKLGQAALCAYGFLGTALPYGYAGRLFAQ